MKRYNPSGFFEENQTESRRGKILSYYIPSIYAFTVVLVEGLELFNTMPFDIGIDIKKIIGVLTLISFFCGKLTKKKDV